MLKYKGYTGHVEFDDESGIFHGEVLDLRDVITFQGRSVEEIEQAFRDSIDDYLDFCQARGEEPDKVLWPFDAPSAATSAPSDVREGKTRGQEFESVDSGEVGAGQPTRRCSRR